MNESASEALLSWAALRGADLAIKDVRPASGPTDLLRHPIAFLRRRVKAPFPLYKRGTISSLESVPAFRLSFKRDIDTLVAD